MFNKVARSGFRQLMEADGFNTFRSLGFPLLTKYADADVDVNITLSLPAGANCVLSWGDGTTTDVIGPQVATAYNKVYASALIDYDVKISGDVDTITLINVGGDPYSGDIANFAIFTGLLSLFIDNTNISGDPASISHLSLIQIHSFVSLLAGDVVAFAGMVNMIDFRINSTIGITGDIASIKTLINMTVCRIYGTGIRDYTQGVLPNWDACTFDLTFMALTQQIVDDFLVDNDTSSVASVLTLNISGNAAPSAVGLAAAASLTVKGRTVIHA